jgi:hypothetical protein
MPGDILTLKMLLVMRKGACLGGTTKTECCARQAFEMLVDWPSLHCMASVLRNRQRTTHEPHEVVPGCHQITDTAVKALGP